MRNFAAAVVCNITILLVGCQEVKQEFSETLHEDAVIENVVYTPSKHESQIKLSAGGGIMMGGIRIARVTVPEKFAVVFRCQHGQFIITRKEVYEKFKDHNGEMVDVAYRKVYMTTYDRKDGEKQIVANELVDYDFLDATFK